MSASTSRQRAYKEVTLQQLRSFCETIRLGSFTAGAKALDLAQPTVWKQVHALERRLGATLVEPHGRGCRPTDEGRLLAELAAPLMEGLNSLERTFQTSRGKAAARLVVAAPPRILVEDLPECIVEFVRRCPHVGLTLKQVGVEEVADAISSGRADLGLTDSCLPDPDDPWLEFEPCYDLEIVLVTPPDHPLARRSRIQARDLCAYPLVNAPVPRQNPVVAAALDALHALGIQGSRIEVFYAAAICRYVELGFGIGLTTRVAPHSPQPHLHERSLSELFGRPAVYLVRRKGTLAPGPAHEFRQTVKDLLSRPLAQPAAAAPARRKTTRRPGRKGRIARGTNL